ncbi:5'-deoxynucleotidase [Permianibacter aggregans]|uniref:5'-deoxynucleotidase n=1 Tax=Permianibacter aggregans TaxID=1510150 RepID=A0A4R6UVI1_9GAMM|nr:5'-deoxynucleotidase [Permianibacter aggregans]QGX39421.1 5'-deoxynucleotidase [Permianibacter aggregans]TDQ49843.1 5'-deoxynucleotidase [Permianibacter aggregans]
MSSPFFAYLARLKFIERWGLKRNSTRENVMEHSYQVAVIAHALAMLRNARYQGTVNPDAIAVAALFHDAHEVFTGDLPSPIKYHSSAIRDAYKAIEADAQQEFLAMLPDDLRAAYAPLVLDERIPSDDHALIKAADVIAAWLKCQAELQAGNQEFRVAAEDIGNRLEAITLPEVRDFMREFAPAFQLTLDEICLRKSKPS